MPYRSKNRQIELTPARTPRSPSSPRSCSSVRSARSPISANRQAAWGFSAGRLRPFCDLASALPVRRQRPTQAVAVGSPIPNRRPAPSAVNPSSTNRITRMRRSLEYALAMRSPNSIYGCILAQSTTFGNPPAAKFRIYPAGNRSSYGGEADLEDVGSASLRRADQRAARRSSAPKPETLESPGNNQRHPQS